MQSIDALRNDSLLVYTHADLLYDLLEPLSSIEKIKALNYIARSTMPENLSVVGKEEPIRDKDDVIIKRMVIEAVKKEVEESKFDILDVAEAVKMHNRRINVNRVFGFSKLDQLLNTRYNKLYISLDSLNRSPEIRDLQSIKWIYTVDNEYRNRGYITTLSPATNIIAAKIFGFSYYLNNLFTYEYGLPRRKFMSITVKEFSDLAYNIEADKYHFGFYSYRGISTVYEHRIEPIFSTAYPTNLAAAYKMDAVPTTDDYFYFKKPLRNLESITLQFQSNFIPNLVPLVSFKPSLEFKIGKDIKIVTGGVPLKKFSIIGYKTNAPHKAIDQAFMARVNYPVEHTTYFSGGALYITNTLIPAGVSVITWQEVTVVLNDLPLVLNMELLCIAEEE